MNNLEENGQENLNNFDEDLPDILENTSDCEEIDHQKDKSTIKKTVNRRKIKSRSFIFVVILALFFGIDYILRLNSNVEFNPYVMPTYCYRNLENRLKTTKEYLHYQSKDPDISAQLSKESSIQAAVIKVIEMYKGIRPKKVNYETDEIKYFYVLFLMFLIMLDFHSYKKKSSSLIWILFCSYLMTIAFLVYHITRVNPNIQCRSLQYIEKEGKVTLFH
uniref:Uncharacterized protein n=1 Tax=Panagrolaimus sp. JU765 TaxID=591449 RepID=A0AC34PZE4_9BILA